MKKISPALEFFFNLSKIQTVTSRKFDGRLGGGLGFNDFLILYHLSLAEGEKLRRIDLAEEIGLTASGVTRLLAPMEKIGLIKREQDHQDARVSYVALAPGGKRLFSERLEKAEMLAEESLPVNAQKKLKALKEIFNDLSRA